MRIQMSSGNCDILASDDVFLFEDSEELKIQMVDDDGSISYLALRFVEDKSGKQWIDPIQKGADWMGLKCYNFSSRLGAGLKRPALIGESNGKNVYIMFWTKLYGSKKPYTRSVQFTIFRDR